MEASTKRNLLIAIASIAGILLLGLLGWFLFFLSKFGSYEDKAYPFAVKYPRQWTVVKAPQPGVAVVFVSPKETALDVLQENINITVQPVPAEMATLRSFSEKITQQMTAVFKGNINISEDLDVTLGGRRAHRMSFEAPKPDNLKTVITWTIKGDQAYILTFLSTITSYPHYKPLLDEVLKSFRLK